MNFETIEKGLTFFQAQSGLVKGLLSFALIAVAAALLVLLWKEPSPSRRENSLGRPLSKTATHVGQMGDQSASVIYNNYITAPSRTNHTTAAGADDQNGTEAANSAMLRKNERIARDVEINPHALRMSVGESGPFMRTSSSLYKIKRTFNVKIENTEKYQAVTDCKIRIEKIEPPEYEGPWLLTSGFSLAAGDHQFVPLVTYGEAADQTKFPCGDSFMIMHVSEPSPAPSAKVEQIVHLKATSLQTSPCEFRCKIWIDAGGRLRITEFIEPKLIPLNQAAKDAFKRIEGTDIAREIEQIGGSPEGILAFTIQQFLGHGLASGQKWTDSEIKPLPPEAARLHISKDGDKLTAQGSSTAIYHSLCTDEERIAWLVQYAKGKGERPEQT